VAVLVMVILCPHYVGVLDGFDVGEELEGLGLESQGEFLEHFRDLWGF